MALKPEDIRERPMSMPLATGFTYRNRADVPDFELSPESLALIAEELKRFEQYQTPPADHHRIIARGVGDSALQGTQ